VEEICAWVGGGEGGAAGALRGVDVAAEACGGGTGEGGEGVEVWWGCETLWVRDWSAQTGISVLQLIQSV
jgi:hypothetical protein